MAGRYPGAFRAWAPVSKRFLCSFNVTIKHETRETEYWIAPNRKISAVRFFFMALFASRFQGQRGYALDCWQRAVNS